MKKLAGGSFVGDVELFYFEDGTGGNSLPADFGKRIIRQLEAVSPYVDKVLCYQYLGIMKQTL